MTALLTCQEFVEFLDDYLAGKLEPPSLSRFNTHLAMCPSCVAYMKTYQTASEAGRKALADEAPQVAPESLIQAILAARRKP